MQIGTKLQAETAEEWRTWLEHHGDTEREIWLVFFKKSAGKDGLSFHDAVLEALCFGWVDSQLKGIDNETYALRFTPRRKGAHWSATNRRLVAFLISEGRMRPGGLQSLPEDIVPVDHQ